MEIWDAVDRIRVVREFSDERVPDEHLTRILNAGRRAGSSKNLQRWGFVVVRDRERLRELSKSGDFAGHVAGAAVAIALVTPDPAAPDQPYSVLFDLGRAAQNMVLVPWDLGIGGVPATVYQHEVVRKILELPPGLHCEYILSFGFPLDRSVFTRAKEPGGRRPLSEVTHEEVWSED